MNDFSIITLVIGLGKTPMTKSEMVISGLLFLGIALWEAKQLIFPKRRKLTRWWGGAPISPIGRLAWVIALSAWAIAMFAGGFEFIPIKKITSPLLLTVFGTVLAASIYDWIVAKRKGLLPPDSVMRVKKKAHLFTLLAICWTAFSLIGVFLIQTGEKGGIIVSIFLWVSHLIFILFAGYFWRTEKQSDVRF